MLEMKDSCYILCMNKAAGQATSAPSPIDGSLARSSLARHSGEGPMRPRPRSRGQAIRVLLGFALFGAFWGAWGAALPAVQTRAGIDDATLGSALLLIGVGALLSMRFTGYLLDWLGRRIVPFVVLAFAASTLAAASANSALTLAAALLTLGALSGAFDVIVNNAAVGYESATERPLLGLAHAAF